jgi:4'-phosphopantetheinyl transferase
MNRVILAYSYLPRQLPAAVRARWRAQLPYARALRLRGAAHAQSQSLLGVALACALLSRAAGRPVNPKQIEFAAGAKPLAPGLPDFSIAHAGSWVVCALASEGSVGVDIEALVARRQVPLGSGAFDAAERSAARTVRAALAIWTTKEAALKAAGASLPELGAVRVRGSRVQFRGRRWYCRTPQISARAVLRVVASQPITALHRRCYGARELLARVGA